MHARRIFISLLILVTAGTLILMAAQGLGRKPAAAGGADISPEGFRADHPDSMDLNMAKVDNEFHDTAKEELSDEQYNVCFLKGTEPPGSGEYYKHFEPGTYHCAVCKSALFESETKYDSGSGWPAFYDAATSDAVATHTDNSLGMRRIEITCAKCGSHLGHVFDDGPAPTGQRYCVNSLSLEFVPEGDSE